MRLTNLLKLTIVKKAQPDFQKSSGQQVSGVSYIHYGKGGVAVKGAVKILALPKRGGGLTYAKIFLMDF